MDSTYHITGPEFSVDDSNHDYIDQGKPNLYSQRILCFGLPASADPLNITNILRDGLVETVKELPILAGIMTPRGDIEGKQTGRREIKPGGTVSFVTKDVTKDFNYVQFRDTFFPQAELDANVLCPVPSWAATDASCPVMAVQANFVAKGLLLVVSIIHFAMDGTGITTVLKLWSDRCRLLQRMEGPQAMSGAPSLGRFTLPAAAFDKSPLAPRPGIKGDIHRHSAYQSVLENQYANTKLAKTMQAPTVNRLYYFSQDALSSLTAASRPAGPDDSSPQPTTTTHDAICALIWRCIILARQRTDRVKDSFTDIAFPVDFRSRIHPPLPPEYIGNAIYSVTARESLEAVHASDSLAKMAQAVRKAILRVNTELIQDFIGMYTSVESIGHIGNAMAEHMADRLVFITSYYRFPLHAFDWGPALGSFDTLRLPKQGMVNGFSVIFPALPDGGCEVCVAGEPEVMEALEKDEMWWRYAKVR